MEQKSISNSIGTKHGELLREQSGVDQNPNLEYLTKMLDIPNTPFKEVIENREDTGTKHFAVLGDHMITPRFNTSEELQQYLQTDYYTIMLAIAITVNDIDKKIRK